jgi:hypothetical protein|nr:MAG TPA: hypothetical protein [Caudoviricetes sp.]
MKNVITKRMKKIASLEGRVSEYIGDLSDSEFFELAQIMEIDEVLDYYPMDELDMVLEGKEPSEILKIGKDLDINDDYFKFDGYGYLEGYSRSEAEQNIRDEYEDEVIADLVDGVNGNVFTNLPDDLKEILETDWDDDEDEAY